MHKMSIAATLARRSIAAPLPLKTQSVRRAGNRCDRSPGSGAPKPSPHSADQPYPFSSAHRPSHLHRAVLCLNSRSSAREVKHSRATVAINCIEAHVRIPAVAFVRRSPQAPVTRSPLISGARQMASISPVNFRKNSIYH